MIKREAKEATKRGDNFDPTNTLEAKFVRNLIDEFLQVNFTLDYEVILCIMIYG